jgi:hypothetical protein
VQNADGTAGRIVHGDGKNVTDANDDSRIHQYVTGAVRLVDDQSKNAELRGIGQRQGTEVDAFFCENIGSGTEAAGLVFKKKRKAV